MAVARMGAWRKSTPLVVLCLVIAVVMGLVWYSRGVQDRVMQLDNSGVWVTNNDMGLFGRANRSAGALDAAIGVPDREAAADLDIFQDGDTALAWARSQSRLFVLDTRDSVAVDGQQVGVDPLSAVGMGGGVVAIIGGDGAIRTTHYAGLTVNILELGTDREPVYTLPAPSGAGVGVAITVDDQGRIFAASATGDAVIIDQRGNTAKFSAGETLQGLTVALVNGVGVIADRASGKVFMTNGTRSTFGPTSSVVVQQTSGPAGQVVFATTAGLYGLPTGGGELTKAFELTTGPGPGAPAQPVVMGQTVYGAWSGTPGLIVRATPGGTQTTSFPPGDGTLDSPVFRVNRGSVLLNDMTNGQTFDVEEQRSLDNWKDLKPNIIGQGDLPNSNKTEPKANDDHLWARAGRVSTLHVMDNDLDPNPDAGIMAITKVTGPDADSFRVAPDGQTLLVDIPADRTTELTASYTISNRAVMSDQGRPQAEQESTAKVTVSLRDPGENAAPAQLLPTKPSQPRPTPPGQTAPDKCARLATLGQDPACPDFAVVRGGTVAIAPAYAWRDADSDAVSVVDAAAGDRALPVSGEGVIQYTAPSGVGDEITEKIQYHVTDGSGAAVAGLVYVRVLGSSDLKAVPPKTRPDVVRGAVGEPVTFYPLANDLTGSDPVNRQAKLALATPVGGRVGLTVSTDLASGAVTVASDKPGPYFLDYLVTYGATSASGLIRVDIGAETGLVAEPDAVVVRGTTPAMVDLLVNDHDAYGSVLTVVSATADDPDRLQTGVVAGRWLRVKMTESTINPKPVMVRYTVINGRGDQATGQVEVRQAPAVVGDKVVVVDDYARVRAGDVTRVAVLENDSSESGEGLVIRDNIPGMDHAGQLKVEDPSLPEPEATKDVGRAFVDGNTIRYEAPPTAAKTRHLRIEYQAGVPMGSPMTGYVWVDVIPEPVPDPTTGEVPADSNHSPQPAPVEVRVVVGDTIRIPVAVFGQDPDGDSVTVAGLLTAPKFGRVVRVGANFLEYESYPDMGKEGTDTFQFVVQDRFGATGIGTIRVGFSAPADPLPPVAVDDVVTAQPGASVLVYPATNDVIAVGTGPVAVVLEGEPAGVAVDAKTGAVTTKAPGADDPVVSVGYHLDAGGVAGVSGQISVRSEPGYLNPPWVYDHVAETVADGVATADVLKDAWDIDGPAAALKLVSVGSGAAPAGTAGTPPPPGPTFDGGVISVPLTERNQVVPFVVEDGDGARSMAVLFVPSSAGGRPYLKSGGVIDLEQNGSKTVSLNDYIKSTRAGAKVYLTMNSAAWVSPSAGLTREVISQDQIKLVARNDYVGPAALTVEVRDSPDATDPDALTGVVTIPVQIGAATPVLWCPDGALDLVQGGPARQVAVAKLCHAWMPTPDGIAGLKFTGSWTSGGDSLTLTGRDGGQAPSDLLVLQAGGTAKPGVESVLAVGVDGFPGVSAELKVRVVAAPKPKISVASVTDVKQGTPVTVPVTITSPMVDGRPNIVSVVQTGGPAASVTHDGLTIRVTPGGGSHGVLRFDVTGSDITDPARTDRQVRASFSVTVYGIPDAPSAPQPATQLRSRSAVVSFQPGADNGAPITAYELQWSGGSQSCGLNTTCEVPGLVNGTAYRFQVRAINKAGPSPWSPTGPAVTPNAIPGAVEGLQVTAPECGAVTLTWTGVAGEGTAPTAYHLTWAGADGPLTLVGDATAYRATGMDNNRTYDFTLVAENSAGLGRQPVTVTGQSSCVPLWPAGKELSVVAADMGNTAQVQVSWPAIDPQGPTPVTYKVTRTGPGGTKTFADTQDTRLGDTGDVIDYDGGVYTYSVVGTNATGGAAHTSRTLEKAWRAVGTPQPWSQLGANPVSVAATGVNGQLEVRVRTFPKYNDASGQVVVRDGSKQVAVLTSTAPVVIGGFTNGANVELTFQACNTSGACNDATSVTLAGGSFGPLVAPKLTTSLGSGRQVCVAATADGNGRNATLVITADQGIGEIYNSGIGTGATSVDKICRDPGHWDVPVTFTAVLKTSATQPARTDSPVATATIRSAVGVPDGWAAGEITVEATGRNGEAILTITKFPDPNGGTLSVQYWVGTGAKTTAPATGPYTLSGLTNGATTTVNVGAYNGTNWGPTTSLTVVTYGPLSAPKLVASPGTGTQVCVQASTPANGTNGRPAQLIVRRADSGVAVYDSGMRDGFFDGPQTCVDAGGYKVTLGFTAQLITAGGLARDNSPESTATATSPPPMPSPVTAAMVNAQATGVDGQAVINLVSLPTNAEWIEVSGLPSGSVLKLTPGQATSLQNGFTNGTARSLTFTPCNPDQCNPAGAYTTSVTTYGPLPKPTSSTRKDGTWACATFSGNGNGAPANLTVAQTANGETRNATGPGSMTASELCLDIGWSASVTFTGTLSDTSGHGRAQQSASVTVTTDAPPPPPPALSVSVTKGAIHPQAGCPTCGVVVVDLSGVQGTASCTFTLGTTANPTSIGWFSFNSPGGQWNSTMPHSSGSAATYWGAGYWTISCSDSGGGSAGAVGTFA